VDCGLAPRFAPARPPDGHAVLFGEHARGVLDLLVGGGPAHESAFRMLRSRRHAWTSETATRRYVAMLSAGYRSGVRRANQVCSCAASVGRSSTAVSMALMSRSPSGSVRP